MLKKENRLTTILLILYLIILTWIILFKMGLNFKYLPYIRSINLIPFKESLIINGRISLKEIFANLVVFIPVGIYINILENDKKLYKKIIPIFLITLFYEVSQYIFHIGATDVTDIIMNTLGGIVGIAITNIFYKIFKDSSKVNKILNVVALICTIVIMLFLLVLIISNL